MITWEVYNTTEGWVMAKGLTIHQARKWMDYLESKGTGDHYIIRMGE